MFRNLLSIKNLIPPMTINQICRNYCTTPIKSETYWLLFYTYVPNVVEKRAPLRPAHLAHVLNYKNKGSLILGGAFANPIDGAALVFKNMKKEDVLNFAQNDPYVVNKIVTEFSVREWTEVVSSLK